MSELTEYGIVMVCGVTGPFNISYSVCRLTGICWGIWFLSYFSSDRSCRY